MTLIALLPRKLCWLQSLFVKNHMNSPHFQTFKVEQTGG